MNNLKKKVIFSIFAVLFMLPGVSLYAQNKTITGTITEENGDAIIGASIMLKGTSNGTVTDFDGKFSLSVPNDAKTLVVSYIGMKTEEVTIKGNTVDLVMTPDSKTNLDELVVIGYGAVKKRDLTGSVASVDGKALRDIPVTTAAEAITGKLAGVQVTTTEGSPDAEIKIRVRGGGSLTGDNTPLYIVDGFPVTSISDIAPSDIQSIDVLKDASSTAIYGARGANGVIIVTTKAPKEGKFSVSYDGYIGFKKIAKTLDVLSPYEFAKWQYEQAALRPGNREDNIKNDYVNYFGAFEDMDIYKSINGSDWQDEIFGRTGITSNHNFSINGGSDKVSYNVSYSRTDDKAIMVESDYYRNNLNLKLNLKPIKNLKINFSGRYSETSATGAGANDSKNGKETSSDTRLKQAILYAPITMRNVSADGDDEEYIGSLYPPTQVVSDNYRKKLTKRYNFNSSVSYEFIKGLTARVEFGVDDEYYYDNRYYGASTDYYRNKAANKEGASLSMVNRNIRTIRNTNTVTYDKKKIFGENHNMSIMLGEETLSTARTIQTSVVEGVTWSIDPEDSFNFAGAAKNRAEFTNFRYRNDNLLSFFGRINYDYAGKYLLTATFREDGSSKFAKGHQWGFFPSVALAWRISDEEFMENTTNWLSNLKLRLSYGTAGNNNVDGSFETRYSALNTGYLSNGTTYWSNGKILDNPDLTWETTHTRNVGLDYGFLGGRISGAIDLYYNSTKDLLINLPTYGTGYETVPLNIGETSNKGIELSINTVILDKPDYGLDFNFNVGWNKNKIKTLGQLSKLEQSSGWNSLIDADYVAEVGNSIGEMYGYVTDGFYTVDDFEDYDPIKGWVLKEENQNTPDNSGNTGNAWGPGALKLRDLDGDGKVTAEKDRTIIGNANPKATGGFSLSGRYKGFDLSANFTWSYGNDILNANKIEFTSNNNGNYKYRNMISDMNSSNRWTNIDSATGAVVTDKATLAALNQNATLWSPNAKFLFHSWAVEDGSFLRLNSVTLGYTLPKSLVNKISLQQVRFYATASNLFCITSYSGFDPEVDSRRKTPLTPGVDYSAYPKSRGFNFGVNLTF